MKKSLIVFIGICIVFICRSGYCDEVDNDVSEYLEHGSVNWSQYYIQARATGYPSKNITSHKIIANAKKKAMQALLETAQSVRIDSFTLVKNLAAENNEILTGITRMIQDAEIEDKKYMSDGAVEVVMHLSLNGGFAQLVLPDDIRQVETIKQAVPVKKFSYFTYEIKTKKKYTGLVVDAKGINVKPAMIIKILDENGKEVYGSAFVSREYVVQSGMCRYVKSYEKSLKNLRVADHPITVKGLRTAEKKQTDIIISNADAAKIRSAPEHIIFLKNCRVIIVID